MKNTEKNMKAEKAAACAAWSTPLGTIEAEIGERGVRALDLKGGGRLGEPAKGSIQRLYLRAGADGKKVEIAALGAPVRKTLAALENYLTNYFAGRKTGALPDLDESGRTDFERGVWAATRRIAAGETLNYGALAKTLGAPKAARAAGGALGRNPLLLLTPCHRVVPANAKAPWEYVGGFASGDKVKRWMLRFEAAR